MIVTVQTLSDSGSFGQPDGDDVERCYIKDIPDILYRWAQSHRKVGSDDRDAVVRVWIGRYDDITDIYPDYDYRLGPRGGIRKERL